MQLYQTIEKVLLHFCCRCTVFFTNGRICHETSVCKHNTRILLQSCCFLWCEITFCSSRQMWIHMYLRNNLSHQILLQNSENTQIWCLCLLPFLKVCRFKSNKYRWTIFWCQILTPLNLHIVRDTTINISIVNIKFGNQKWIH